ncbi:anaerobic glycerol-3-phosphate dehydrogenase subunit A [Oceanidesulfovibrio indonesiensis]|uniref:Glycerol-3-phosphate dehydrogenase n=1 Tax=Oceanidesulfovibrio indonesiensis TaxID=54767 RepID=A0A7M3MHR2_9BACT|nr:anaerobic glycerol-3-phosphate dehydrogenase subunit A [Oceanidesulfovibrio indonesiensis]
MRGRIGRQPGAGREKEAAVEKGLKPEAARVLIIGGGVTGTGLARDLALRGVPSLLVEKRDLAAGASGGNHGLLHSGARYVGSDPEAARECMEESTLLKRLAPHCIEDTKGLFVAVAGDDEQYVAEFPRLCANVGLPAKELDPKTARVMEPCLSEDVIAAYEVRDATVDPFMLCLDNMSQARSMGAQMLRNTRVTAFHVDGGAIRKVLLRNERNGEEFTLEPELVINASGAWAGFITSMAGVPLSVVHSQGTLVITQDRLSTRVINRLRMASDADILVPGGSVSILGTTSVRIDDPDECRPTVEEVDQMLDDATAMVPILENTRYIRAYAGVRPLVAETDENGGAGNGDNGDRSVSRGYTLIDHAKQGVENFITITGGKLTTYRFMAEKAGDLACRKLGVDAPCLTRTEPLPPSDAGRWTDPGVAARTWVDRAEEGQVILCECEMVSSGVVDFMMRELEQNQDLSALSAMNVRSRVGKGPCQGCFCGPRITAHLYDEGWMSAGRGLGELKEFINRRWRGKEPVLWGVPLQQAELQEALLCGMLELEREF